MNLSELIRNMAAAGAPAEAIALAVEAIEARDAQDEQRRANQRERTRRSREKRDSNVTVTLPSQAGNTQVSPKKETSPTPPKEKTTPSQSEPNGSSKTPRAALECVLDANRAGQVLDHRQRLRKPLTVRAAELLAGQFAECPDPNAAADAMVLNGWQGFKPEWMSRQQTRGSPQAPQQAAPSQADVFAFIGRNSSNGPGPEHDDSGRIRPALSHVR